MIADPFSRLGRTLSRLALIALACAACRVSQATGAAGSIPIANQQQVRDGIWKSAGVNLLVIGNGRYQTYQVTSISCIATDAGSAADVAKLYPLIESWSVDELVVSGYDWRYHFRRLARLPAACRERHEASDPLYNFDVFWQYFQENYPSFALRGIDWTQMRRSYRARMHGGISEAALIALLGEMVEKINDPHVFISNGMTGEAAVSFASPDPHGIAAAVRAGQPGRTTSEYRAAADKIQGAIDTELRYEILHGNYSAALNERLLWGMLAPDVGYLRSSLSMGLFPSGTPREQMYAQLDATLERIFSDLRGARALIIDVTTNTGGAGFVADMIAQRVITAPTSYRSSLQTARGLTESFTKTLAPAGTASFTGPVILLISGNTVSSGEMFPIVLHGLPNVTVLGEPTLGATSSYEVMQLPNGWRVGIPNYVVNDRDGRWYERHGVQPDIAATVFDPEHLISGFRTFLDGAVAVARSKASTFVP